MLKLALILGLFIGIPIGMFLIKFAVPYLDWYFELFIAKISESITEHNLNISMMSAEMFREYPELSNNPDGAGQTNLIGFQCYGENDEIYDDEQDKFKSKLNNMGKRMVF